MNRTFCDNDFPVATDSIELAIPTLEVADLLSIIENGGKSLELLLESANDVIYQATRQVIGEAMDANKPADQALIDASHASLDWEAIANKPKAERRGNGISKEEWEAFAEDYKSVMSMVMVDKSPEQLAIAASHLSTKFAKCRFNKQAITVLRNYLAAWFSATPNKEDFATIYEALDNRAEVLLSTDDAGRLVNTL